jgi:shikimate kinase
MTNDARNIVLTGFMGTGKTTVGGLIAQQLERSFFDMDAAIEHRTGLTISRIFAAESEPYFRAIERGLCYELALQNNLVIATGGGALIDQTNYRALAKTGLIICLKAAPEIIEARLRASDDRPLAGRWRELLEERQSIYDAMPHQLDTTAKTTEQVAQEIITLWQTLSR